MMVDLRIFQGRLFSLHKPFPAVGDCKIIDAGRPVKVVRFALNFPVILFIILFQVLNS
jgi:hypothetical protein